MSNLQNIQTVSVGKLKASHFARPAWWLVLRMELTDLWIGGKALTLLLIYSVLLGIIAYAYSFSAELRLIPPREAVYELLKNAMAFSMFMGLIIAADSLSGERDRATLESLLLTPVDRRHIMIGKFLTALSIWLAAYILSIPHLYVLAQGDNVLGPALFWSAITGTVLVIGYIGVGMLSSFFSSTNKVSYFVSLAIYALLLVPAEMPGDAIDIEGGLVQWINPMSAVNHFLSKHLVNYRPVAEFWTWLVSSIVLAVVTLLLLGYTGSNLRLEAGRGSRLWAKLKRGVGLASIAGLMVISLTAYPVHAFQSPADDLSISIDSPSRLVKMGSMVEFNAIVTNHGQQTSSPLIVAMNVINLEARGDVLDLEDWASQRTQYIDTLAPGKSVNLDWAINTILEGDYMVYIAVIPEPTGTETTSQPVASSGIHLTVTSLTSLKPEDVLPFAVGEPLLLLGITYFVYRRRRQQIDLGGPS
jgi:ABC-2 type transport system permease protein